MIKNRFVVAFLFFGIFAAAQDLTVTKIAIFGNETTRPEVILATFLEVSAGDTLPQERLEAAASLARDRLVGLRYFSSVLVTVVVSQSTPGTASNVVEFEEGFLGRFGGGPVWGMAGVDNIGGRGQDATLWLGLNKQAAAWTNQAPGWKGGTWNAEAGNDPVDWTDSAGEVHENHAVGSTVQMTQALGWGWAFSGSQTTRWELSGDYGSGDLRTDQGVRVIWNTTPPGFSPDRGSIAQIEISGLLPQNLVRQQADFRTYGSLGWGFKVALHAAVGTQQGTFTDRDALNLAGFDGLRKPFDSTDLSRTRIWTSTELRWSSLDMPLLGFCTVTVEPALIADAGQGWSDGSSGSAWDAGVALRVFFGAPVEVPLRIETTLDNRGRRWSGFGVEAPY